MWCEEGIEGDSDSMEVEVDTNIEEAGKSEDCAVSDGREVGE
jgi:hypothetical protein